MIYETFDEVLDHIDEDEVLREVYSELKNSDPCCSPVGSEIATNKLIRLCMKLIEKWKGWDE
jgi:hypothetical protein